MKTYGSAGLRVAPERTGCNEFDRWRDVVGGVEHVIDRQIQAGEILGQHEGELDLELRVAEGCGVELTVRFEHHGIGGKFSTMGNPHKQKKQEEERKKKKTENKIKAKTEPSEKNEKEEK